MCKVKKEQKTNKKKHANIAIILCIVISLSLILVLSGCSLNGSDDIRIEVYRSILDTSTNAYMIDETPLFTNLDLDYVDWYKQEYIFTEDFLSELPTPVLDDIHYIGGSKLLGTSPRDKFTIFVDGEKIYEGLFEQGVLSSFYPIGMVLKDLENGIDITFVEYEGSNIVDKRFDEKLEMALDELDLI